MTNTQKIKIKLRSGTTNYSGVLDTGESFYNTNTTRFYVGDGVTETDNLPYFLNNNTGVTIDTDQTISGNKTFTSDIGAKSFIKTGSSNEEVLLGDGSTKTLSEFSAKNHNHIVNIDMAKDDILSIVDVGTLPSLSHEYENQVLSMHFDKGSLPTVASKSVLTNVKATTGTGYTVTFLQGTNPSFSESVVGKTAIQYSTDNGFSWQDFAAIPIVLDNIQSIQLRNTSFSSCAFVIGTQEKLSDIARVGYHDNVVLNISQNTIWYIGCTTMHSGGSD